MAPPLATYPPLVLLVANPEPLSMRALLASRLDPGRRLPPSLPGLITTLAARVDRWLKSRGGYHPVVHVLGEFSRNLALDPSQVLRDRAVLQLPPPLELDSLLRAERDSSSVSARTD